MSDLDGVPEAWREVAEQIRAHLCLLRGGAPFLSPSDCWQLVSWLETGVRPAAILAALERAALARRAQRARTPLSLVAAKRHLGRPLENPLVNEPFDDGSEQPLAPLVREVRAAPAMPYELSARTTLCAVLETIRERDDGGVLRALEAIRRYFEDVWHAAGEPERATWRAAAVEDLGDLLGLIEENGRGALIEEAARDMLRQRLPALGAAAVLALLRVELVDAAR